MTLPTHHLRRSRARLRRALTWVSVLRRRRDELKLDASDVADVVDYADAAHQALEPFARAWEEMKDQPRPIVGTTPLEVAINFEHFRQAWEVFTHQKGRKP